MNKQFKTITWGILNILLTSLLMTHCSACKDNEQENLIAEQQKLIEAFKKNYVELASFSAFDDKIAEIKQRSVEDIDKYIKEFEAYKAVAEAEKRVESTTDTAKKQGYINGIKDFIQNSKLGTTAKNTFKSIFGSNDTKDQIVSLTKKKLLDEYKFNSKLATLDNVIGCVGDMIAILENIRQTKK
jgi:hypothetical protein